MTSLRELIRASQDDLPITVRHERWLKTSHNPKYSDKAIEFARSVLAKEVGGGRSRITKFRGSGTGHCNRRRIFSALGMPEKDTIDSQLASIFHTGNFLHLKWQMAGLTEGWLVQAEIPVGLEELEIAGTMDGLIYDNSMFEFKSINANGFRNVMSSGPKSEHVAQVHVYMLMANLDKASILYENKDSQDWREFVINRDDALMDKIITDLDYLNECLDVEELPPILDSCAEQVGSVYRHCPYSNVCLGISSWPG